MYKVTFVRYLPLTLTVIVIGNEVGAPSSNPGLGFFASFHSNSL